jgi:hypothetical protein
MPLASNSGYYSSKNEDGQGRIMQYQDSFDFLDNPFGSILSSIAFLGLCGFAIASIYILAQKYHQAREYKQFSSRPRPVSNLESARALATGIDTGPTWIWQAEPELATADLLDIREGLISDCSELSPLAISPYKDNDSDKGLVAGCDLEDIDGRRMMQHENAPERYTDPAGNPLDEDRASWIKQKQAGEELDQMRKTFRSRMVRGGGVVMGQVGGSTIAQRRRAESNKSI